MLSNKLKERFCHDMNLSIGIMENPYFIERVELYDKMKELVEYEHMIEEKFDNNEERYFEYYNKVKDDAINYIKSSPAWNAIQADPLRPPMFRYNGTPCPDIEAIYNRLPKRDAYKDTNIGKYIISIDMCKANFTALCVYGLQHPESKFVPDDKVFDYEWFMSQFTDIEHIIKSKYIRQVVFGNCNPSKQTTYEKLLMCYLLTVLQDGGYIDIEKDVTSLCSDEILIDANDWSIQSFQRLREATDKFSKENFPVRAEFYRLSRVYGSDAYVKEFLDCDKTYEIKCATPEEMPFLQRMMRSEPFNKTDLVFRFKNKLAQFMEYPNLIKTYLPMSKWFPQPNNNESK